MRTICAAGSAEIQVAHEEVAVKLGPGPREGEGMEIIESGVGWNYGLAVCVGRRCCGSGIVVLGVGSGGGTD